MKTTKGRHIDQPTAEHQPIDDSNMDTQPRAKMTTEEALKDLDRLSAQISKHWRTGKNAQEALSEIRR